MMSKALPVAVIVLAATLLSGCENVSKLVILPGQGAQQAQAINIPAPVLSGDTLRYLEAKLACRLGKEGLDPDGIRARLQGDGVYPLGLKSRLGEVYSMPVGTALLGVETRFIAIDGSSESDAGAWVLGISKWPAAEIKKRTLVRDKRVKSGASRVLTDGKIDFLKNATGAFFGCDYAMSME